MIAFVLVSDLGGSVSMRSVAFLALLATSASVAPSFAQFETRSTLLTHNDTQSYVVGDFNRDGIPDIAAVNPSGSVEVFLGNGDGTFRTGSTYSVDVLFSAATASLRHNGMLDLVVGGGTIPSMSCSATAMGPFKRLCRIQLLPSRT
jgi:hypothetical protein